MNAVAKEVLPEPLPTARRVYDPNNLDPQDIEARKCDDVSEDIDWDEIIATTQEDWEAGRYELFDPSDYPTEDAFIEAMERSTDAALRRERA